MSVTGIQKLRYLLATSPRLVITGCLLLALVSVAGAGVTYANPPEVTVTDQTDRQTIQSTLETRAIVERDTMMYTRGEELTNNPVYLREPTPNVTVAAVTTTPEEAVQIEQQLFLVYEVRSADGAVFWQRITPLATSEGASPGGESVTEATIHISAIEQELAALRAETGDAGAVSVHLKMYTGFETPDYAGALDDRGELTIRDDSYSLPQLSDQHATSTDVQRTRPVPAKVLQPSVPGLGQVVIPHTTMVFTILAGLLFAATGMSVVWANRVDGIRAQTSIHDSRYEDWISEGTLPERLDYQRIYMESLEELADIAIDMEKRIIHDGSRDHYAVIDGAVAYVYTRGFEWN